MARCTASHVFKAPHERDLAPSSSTEHIQCPYYNPLLRVSPSHWGCGWFIIPTHRCQPVVGCSVGTIWWSMGARRSHESGVPKRCLVFNRLPETSLMPLRWSLSHKRPEIVFYLWDIKFVAYTSKTSLIVRGLISAALRSLLTSV